MTDRPQTVILTPMPRWNTESEPGVGLDQLVCTASTQYHVPGMLPKGRIAVAAGPGASEFLCKISSIPGTTESVAYDGTMENLIRAVNRSPDSLITAVWARPGITWGDAVRQMNLLSTACRITHTSVVMLFPMGYRQSAENRPRIDCVLFSEIMRHWVDTWFLGSNSHDIFVTQGEHRTHRLRLVGESYRRIILRKPSRARET